MLNSAKTGTSSLPLIALLLGLFTGLIALAAPDPDHLPAIWVARSDDTLKVDVDSALPVLALSEGSELRSLLIDPLRARLWGYGERQLRSYAFDGTPVSSTTLPSGSHRHRLCGDTDREEEGRDEDQVRPRGDADPRGEGVLALQPRDGTVWLAVDRCLYRFDDQGEPIDTITTEQPIQDIAFDSQREWLWVAASRELIAFDQDGAQAVRVDAAGREAIQAIDWAPPPPSCGRPPTGPFAESPPTARRYSSTPPATQRTRWRTEPAGSGMSPATASTTSTAAVKSSPACGRSTARTPSPPSPSIPPTAASGSPADVSCVRSLHRGNPES